MADYAMACSRRSFKSAVDTSGCSCVNSRCLKKYCVCYRNAASCLRTCRCKDCANSFGASVDPESQAAASVADAGIATAVTSWNVPVEVEHLKGLGARLARIAGQNRYYNARLAAKTMEDGTMKDKMGQAEQLRAEPAALEEREHLDAQGIVPQQSTAELADQAFALQLQCEEEEMLARETEELAQWARLQAFLALPTSTKRIGEDVATKEHTESVIQQHGRTHQKVGDYVGSANRLAAASDATAPTSAPARVSAPVDDDFMGQQIFEKFVGFGTYTGIVTRKSVDGRYVIRYDDGDEQVRTEQQVRALLQRSDEQCTSDNDQQQDEEQTSAFDDTSRSEAQQAGAPKSGYTGVSWEQRSKKWEARIQQPGAPMQHLGCFLTELEAAITFDGAARRLRGDTAHGGRSCPTAPIYR